MKTGRPKLRRDLEQAADRVAGLFSVGLTITLVAVLALLLGLVVGLVKWMLAAETASLGASLLWAVQATAWLVLVVIAVFLLVSLVRPLIAAMCPEDSLAWTVMDRAQWLATPLVMFCPVAYFVLDAIGQADAARLALVVAGIAALILLVSSE